ncbi:MAG: 50S ribosomal protein L24 [Candidatus Altiarchaeales archaeon]|nr:MAG: 50S ribosomal protein L24 [Candidatus Altiarchaeales archaeon]
MKRPKSKKPGKQRRYQINAPLHRRRKMLSATLDKKLREKYNRRNIPIRRGDKVRIMRGEFKGVMGEVVRVLPSKYKIYIDGVTIKKADGTAVERPIDPSNVMITEIYMEDKERREMLERKLK